MIRDVMFFKYLNTLSKLEEKGVIQQVNKPTEWVTSLIIVEKSNGKLHIYRSKGSEQSNKKGTSHSSI